MAIKQSQQPQSAHSIAAIMASPPVEPARPAAAAPRRKSRPLQRKTSHSLIERRRREKINEGLVSLQNLVPACRVELHETLKTKAYTVKKNARKSKEEIDKEVDCDLDEKIGSQMVLEKLCIISHTVDYVQELQQKLAAYKRICRCSPPLMSDIDGIHIQGSHQYAHAHDFEGEEADASGSVGDGGSETSEQAERRSSASTDGLAARTSAEKETSVDVNEPTPSAAAAWTRCHAKCQRHWGSNNPIKLHGQRDSAKKRRAQSIGGREDRMQELGDCATAHGDAYAPLHRLGGRAHSVDGETSTDQVDNGQEHDATLGLTDRQMANETDDSDLELDEWEPRRFASHQSDRDRMFPALKAGQTRKRSFDKMNTARGEKTLRTRAASLYTNNAAHDQEEIGCKDCGESVANIARPTPTPMDKDLCTSEKKTRAQLPRTESGLGLLADLSARGGRVL